MGSLFSVAQGDLTGKQRGQVYRPSFYLNSLDTAANPEMIKILKHIVSATVCLKI